MARSFRKRHLSYSQKIMLILFLIILFLSVFLSIYFWRLSAGSFEVLENTLMQRSIKSVQQQLNTALETAQNATTQLAREIDLQEMEALDLSDPDAVGPHNIQITNTFRSIMNYGLSNSNVSIQFLGLFLKNGYSIGSCNTESLPWQNFDQCCAALSDCGISDLDGYVPTAWLDDFNFSGYRGSSHCLVGIRFLYENISLEKIGVILIGVEQSNLQTIFKSIPYPLFLVRADGTIISAAQSGMIGKSFPNMDILAEHVAAAGASIATVPDGSQVYAGYITGNACFLISPVDSLTQKSTYFAYSRQVIIVTICVLFAGMLLSWLSSRGLTKSLRRLKGTVQQVYEGNLSARFQTQEQDEIAYLGLKINDMLEQVEDFFHTQERDAAEKKNLEQQLMQAQINPHLLYNTLNSVIWIIRKNDTQKAEDLILSLSNFFRLTLSNGNEEISLADEVAMIRYYLDIQNLGRGKAYSLRDEISEEWRGCKILRLSLQPLVENSVLHGFSDWRNDGKVVITAVPDETQTTLHICIQDNGIGILAEDLSALQANLNAYPPKKASKHYGLYNIQRRIQNKYGKAFGFAIESEVGEYTKVVLTIPIQGEKT